MLPASSSSSFTVGGAAAAASETAAGESVHGRLHYDRPTAVSLGFAQGYPEVGEIQNADRAMVHALMWGVQFVALPMCELAPWGTHLQRVREELDHLRDCDTPEPRRLETMRRWLIQLRPEMSALARQWVAETSMAAVPSVVPAPVSTQSEGPGTSQPRLSEAEYKWIQAFMNERSPRTRAVMADCTFVGVSHLVAFPDDCPWTGPGTVMTHGPRACFDMEQGNLLISGDARQWAALQFEMNVVRAQPGKNQVPRLTLELAKALEAMATPRGRDDPDLRASRDSEDTCGLMEQPSAQDDAIWTLARALCGLWPHSPGRCKFVERFLGPIPPSA